MILKFRDLIEKLEKDVYAVMRLEREERAMSHSEAQVKSCVFCVYVWVLVYSYAYVHVSFRSAWHRSGWHRTQTKRIPRGRGSKRTTSAKKTAVSSTDQHAL